MTRDQNKEIIFERKVENCGGQGAVAAAVPLSSVGGSTGAIGGAAESAGDKKVASTEANNSKIPLKRYCM